MERDDTRERFLAAIADRVPADRIAEAHVFSPIRQGGTESGVAVIAAREGDALERLAIYTARYRLVLKGPERGKWEFAMQADADAPLLTVDKVVQGVQRRSGDAEDPVKLTGEDFRPASPSSSPTAPSSTPASP
ncbi:MAG TPA: hypothetical protein VEB19_13940 [Gemmatimonadaceae bacterium]|nr:hypothetical protein [Gemmatimonadaceae bacterium]